MQHALILYIHFDYCMKSMQSVMPLAWIDVIHTIDRSPRDNSLIKVHQCCHQFVNAATPFGAAAA
eukprot:scaffold55454_cov21-Prasinocladus_malaysianus.AAC.2